VLHHLPNAIFCGTRLIHYLFFSDSYLRSIVLAKPKNPILATRLATNSSFGGASNRRARLGLKLIEINLTAVIGAGPVLGFHLSQAQPFRPGAVPQGGSYGKSK
jgi:hypothetical protein